MADSNTTNYSLVKPEVGASDDTWGTKLNTDLDSLDTLLYARFEGTTAISPDLTALNIGGVAVTATAAELNILDGVTATTAELNYVDGVTSNVQTQLDTKAATATSITAGAGLTGGGDLSASRTLSHADTSSQASVDNSGTTFIQDITLDTYGHITAIGSATVSVPDTLGVNQSYAGITLTTGTWYQNTAGRAIAIYYRLNTGGGEAYVSTYAGGGVMVGGPDGDSGTWDNGYFIVPASHYYRTTGSSNINASRLS